MKTEQKFDLLITECFNSRLFYTLSYKFQIPFITLSSSTLFSWVSHDVGNPTNPSYIPSMLSYQSNKMNFFQRVDNTLIALICTVAQEIIFNSKEEEMKVKYFGHNIPSLRDISKNMSLVMVNSHFTLNFPRPLVPGIIEIGGNFLKQSKPLPEVRYTFEIMYNKIIKLRF